jgi:hypothetical protein
MFAVIILLANDFPYLMSMFTPADMDNTEENRFK